MKKIVLSEEDRDRVIKLRQGGLSWYRIGKEIGKPRHVVKRSYEEWERTLMAEELKLVRREVAMEDFKEHRQLLMDIARDLTGLLEPASLAMPTVDADSPVNALYEINRWAEKIGGTPTEKQVERWNRMLFKGLQEHTIDRVRWEALDEWEKCWEDCRQALQAVYNEIQLSLGEILEREPELSKKFEKVGGRKRVDEVSGVALKSFWLALRVGRPGMTLRLSDVKQGATVFIRTEDGSPDAEIPWSGKESARLLTSALNEIVGDIYSGKGVRRVIDCIEGMKSSYGELEKTLDAMVLGPIILTTRCGLCPV